MTQSFAGPEVTALLKRLAEAPGRVLVSRQARSDMMAYNLRLEDVCDAIVDWIDAQERVKPTTLHSSKGRVGQAAWEIKPRFNGILFYLKLTVDDRDDPDEALVVLSCHLDH
jgi:hypothetical protein